MMTPTRDELDVLAKLANGWSVVASDYHPDHGFTRWTLWTPTRFQAGRIDPATARSLRDRGWIVEVPRTNRYRISKLGRQTLRIFGGKEAA